mmetsp:Transcript_5699/g.13585  ORF Transcript_5699/g.13585 Transcript_5699/m.13585 type:complete len:625 (+) Transcript_5699:287-2161(+)
MSGRRSEGAGVSSGAGTSGSLFGAPAAQSLFGAGTPPPAAAAAGGSTASIFGGLFQTGASGTSSTAQSALPVFGQTAAAVFPQPSAPPFPPVPAQTNPTAFPGLFGATTSSSASSGPNAGGLFGSTSSGGGLFGGSSSGGGGLFGSTGGLVASSQAGSTGSIFANTNASGGGLFGSTSPITTPIFASRGSGLFSTGSTTGGAADSSAFPAGPPTPNFGQASSASSSQSIFGAAPAAAAAPAGGSQGGGLFGSLRVSGGLFGEGAPVPIFGNSGSSGGGVGMMEAGGMGGGLGGYLRVRVLTNADRPMEPVSMGPSTGSSSVFTTSTSNGRREVDQAAIRKRAVDKAQAALLGRVDRRSASECVHVGGMFDGEVVKGSPFPFQQYEEQFRFPHEPPAPTMSQFHRHIIAQKEYAVKSPEEIRFEDYEMGRSQSPPTSFFGTSDDFDKLITVIKQQAGSRAKTAEFNGFIEAVRQLVNSLVESETRSANQELDREAASDERGRLEKQIQELKEELEKAKKDPSRPLDRKTIEGLPVDELKQLKRDKEGEVAMVTDTIISKLEGDDKCIICMDKAKEVVFIPCRHQCVCQGCANELKKYLGPPNQQRLSWKCPVCSSDIADVIVPYK